MPTVSSPPDLSPGSEFAGHRILEHIASGDSAEVFRVEQTLGGPQFALKVMAPAFRFRQHQADAWVTAATVGAKVGGEHVVYVHAAGVDVSGLAWLAMELLEGETLTQLLDREGRLPATEAADLLMQSADALGRAHAHAVIHSELSSDNVFLVPAGSNRRLVKLLNLGLASFVRATRPSGTARLGTPEWLAPEETRLGKGVSPATDVWALGLLAFQILVGVGYWKGVPGGELIRQIGYAPMSSASVRAAEFGVHVDLPLGFDDWFLQCVERDPNKRFRDAVQAVQVLTNVLPATRGRVAADVAATLTSADSGKEAAAAAAAEAARAIAAVTSAAPLGRVGAPVVDSRYRRGVNASARRRSSTWLWIGLGGGLALLGLFAVVGAGVGWYLAGGSEPELPPTLEPLAPSMPTVPNHGGAPVPIWPSDPSWGEYAAPVTIVEFGDLQCPICARAQNTLDQIKAKYGGSKVRIVWKHLPLSYHERARAAAEAAVTVHALGGSEAFWQFVRLASASRDDLSWNNFVTWANQAGVDAVEFGKQRDAQPQRDKVDRDGQLAASLGIESTPTFLINGMPLGGMQPYDKFVEIIDVQLVEASELQAKGTPPEQIYPLLVARNAEELGPNRSPVPVGPSDDKIWQVPVLDDDPQLGPDDALVTIVEFAEFECPFCKRVRKGLEQVVETYGKDVRIVWKDNALAFHTHAKAAALLARAAYEQSGDSGFWKAHDALFESAPSLDESDLKSVAEQLGLTWAEVSQVSRTQRHLCRLDASARLARDLDARGVPQFFINGRRLNGAQEFERFRDIIDEELAKAKAMVAAGTARSDVYQQVVERGQASAKAEKRDYSAPPDESPVRGPADAEIVVRVFGDFQCAYCARVMPTVDELMAKYPDRIRIVWHDFPLPFHKQAELAAEAAHEVFLQKGSEAFWKYGALLFKAQRSPGLDRDTLEAYARTVDVDMDRFGRALDEHTHTGYLERQRAAASAAEVRGTPSTLINGYYVGGSQPLEVFSRIVDLALAEK